MLTLTGDTSVNGAVTNPEPASMLSQFPPESVDAFAVQGIRLAYGELDRGLLAEGIERLARAIAAAT